VGSRGHVVHSSASGTQNIDALFFMLKWDLVGYAGHVVHSSASAAQNVGALFFMLGWPRYAFHKTRAETCYSKIVFLHPV
jgi:hypothetical protein